MVRVYFFLVLILTLIQSCDNPYEGNWIITDVSYKGKNMLSTLSSRNVIIYFDIGGATPSMSVGEFVDADIAYENSFKIKRSDGKDSIFIKGSSFFTGRYVVECLSEECCRILMYNDEKRIEMLYNSSRQSSSERRNCLRPANSVEN